MKGGRAPALLLATAACAPDPIAIDVLGSVPCITPSDDGAGHAQEIDGRADSGRWGSSFMGRVPQVVVTHRIESGEDAGASTPVAADLVGDDGVVDLLAVGYYGQRLWVHSGPFSPDECERTGAGAAATLESDASSSVVGSPDTDGDGRFDLFVDRGINGISRWPTPVRSGHVLDIGEEVGAVTVGYTQPVAVGDVTGDGLADLLINQTGRAYGGDDVIYLLPGPPAPHVDPGGPAFVPDETDWNWGRALTALGDVDGDGVPDVAFSSESASTFEVEVYVVTEVPTGPVHPRDNGLVLSAPSELLYSNVYQISPSGDINGDGYEDVAIVDDRVRFFHGPFVSPGEWSLTSPDTQVVPGLDESLYFARRGDVDGDGFDDVLVGDGRFSPSSCPYWYTVLIEPCDAGAIYVRSGPLDASAYTTNDLGDRIDSNVTNGNLGRIMVGDADLDGDGIPELVATTFEGMGGAYWRPASTYVLFGV